MQHGVPDQHHHVHPDHDHELDHDHHHHGRWSGLRHAITPHSHDHAESVDDAMVADRKGIRAVKISLVALGITAVVQLVIALLSSSVALLADTIHNFSDALTSLPLWVAFVLGRRAPTRRYTYGYGRAEDLAGLFVVGMIALSALTAGWQVVSRLLDPRPVEHVWWVAAAGLVGFVGNELVAVYRIRTGRAIGSAALVADGLHARTDGFTSLAVLVGALGVAAGWPLADPLIGLVITVAILAVLWTAARDIYRRLMDAVDPVLTERAEQTLAQVPGVLRVSRVRMRWIGHRLQADAELDVDPTISLAQAHDLAHRAEHALVHAVGKLDGAVVHAYPASAAKAGRTAIAFADLHDDQDPREHSAAHH